jgi:alpha-D-ribose 1-methylphosphonate 5-triphosphate synthase subunit PhnH
MAQPSMTTVEARTHATFTALMRALSYPGRVFRLPADGIGAFDAIVAALVDLETSYYTDHAALGRLLASTGGRARPIEAAMYQFYPTLGEAALSLLKDAPIGTYSYPDESVTLMIGCALGAGQALRLAGPGIAGVEHLWVDGIPETFWALREQVCRYPLGWDILLVSGDQVAGLPRTTRIEVE